MSEQSGLSSLQHVLKMLKEEHRAIQKLFQDFELAGNDAAALQNIVASVCTTLKIHMILEEEIFYPAVRTALYQNNLVNMALAEHAVAKYLIRELQSMHPYDKLYKAKFYVLGKLILQHVKEEEEEMFPKVQAARIDASGMLQEIMDFKDELQSEPFEEDPNLQEDYLPGAERDLSGCPVVGF